MVDGTERGDSGSKTVVERALGNSLLGALNLRQMVESKIRKTPNKNMIAGSESMVFSLVKIRIRFV